ncbi:hypothetical protein [Amycolatopsis benzoatilytica]|uniref:hypothetical protein n=1 Tax=Amycolatopsis benzoatilytica TaxID=346045 RepID=UPI0003773BC3|nr:hypothetical protein [Amycolatopsis benzoatilytica]
MTRTTGQPLPDGGRAEAVRPGWTGDHDPADQNWQEHGDEVRIAAQRAGRAWQQPETD